MQSIFQRSSSIRTQMCPYHTQSFSSQELLGTRSETQVCWKDPLKSLKCFNVPLRRAALCISSAAHCVRMAHRMTQVQ